MINMKCYKLTLARIGKQENWAGWRIAGMSGSTPRQLLDSFESFHGSKNHIVSSLNKPIELYEVAEHRGNLFVSNIRFGTKDMLGRPSFSVKGVAFPISENPNIFAHPENFLKLSYEDFGFQLKTLYDEKKNLKKEYITGSNVVTIHDDVFYFNRQLSLDQIIEQYFSDKENLESFVRSIFWSGNNNQTTLCLKVANGFTDYFEIMYLVYSLLPLSMRSSFSFRTYNLRNLSGAKVVFSEEIPCGKYYDITSGKNNIFIDNNILNNSRKLSFIDYILEHLNDESNEEYFELLQSSLEKMGQPKTTDLNTIEMAHNMLMTSDEDDTELTDMEILKKFQEYVSLGYSNEVVDENIVKYLNIIIQKSIHLNDTLMNKLEAKLKSTKYIPLIELGYEYKASKLLEDCDKQNSFQFLLSIENDKDVHDKYMKYILEFVGGPMFLDEYYGVFYAEKCIENIDDLCNFYVKTKNLPERTRINKRINDTATSYSMKCVELMREQRIDFNYEKHIDLLNDKLGLASTSRLITDEMKRKYWSEFKFSEFDFNRINDYLTYLPYENWQFNLIKGIKGILDDLSYQKAESIKRFNSYVRGQIVRGVNLSPNEQDYLKKEFQKYCLLHADKKCALDFWFEVSKLLSIQEYIEFIFHNDIAVFTNPELFETEFVMSKLYEDRTADNGSRKTYYNFCQNLLMYIDSHGQYDDIGRVLIRIQNKDKGRNIYSSSKVVEASITMEEYSDLKNESGIRSILQKSKEGVKGIFPSKRGKHMKQGKHGK